MDTTDKPTTTASATPDKVRTIPAEKPTAIRLTDDSSDTRVLDNIRRYRRKAAQADKLAEALRDCVTSPGALAERSHEYALRRLATITATASEALSAYESEVRQ